jgi:hypothetical protein
VFCVRIFHAADKKALAKTPSDAALLRAIPLSDVEGYRRRRLFG